MKAIKNVDAKVVDYRNGHILYVEGNEQSIDVEVLKEFLNNIWIQPMGMASSITSVAKSLYSTHPNSYFLIDRDYRISDEKIEEYWASFPDPNTSNLLVWRRRELENYFLVPTFLLGSGYCKEEFKDNNGLRLQEKVVLLATERLYLDVANYVVVFVREYFKKSWIEKFSNLSDFPDKKTALKQLTQKQEFKAFSEKVSQQTAEKEIAARFQEYLDKMTGGKEPLLWGTGEWLNMISGKEIFHTLVNLCFQVMNQEKKTLQGKEAINLVAGCVKIFLHYFACVQYLSHWSP